MRPRIFQKDMGEVKTILVDDTEVDEYNNVTLKSTADAIELFDSSLLSTCNVEHISNCDCQQANVKSQYIKYFEEEMADLIHNNHQNNKHLIEIRKEHAMDKAIISVARYCRENEIKCSVERKKLDYQLSFFNKKYDLSDPRVFTIVEALMNQMLSVHRMQQYSNVNGILNVWYDKNDNRRVSINPVEEMKLKYDDARISAISTLDKIMEGQKLNINLKTININEVFKEINLEPGEYREL